MLLIAMLLGLFVKWEVDGAPQYSSMEQGQSIAYVLPPMPLELCTYSDMSTQGPVRPNVLYQTNRFLDLYQI